MIKRYHIDNILLDGEIMTHKMNISLEKNDWDIEYLSKQYPMFGSKYSYLIEKYDRNDLSVSETLYEIKMSKSDFYEKKKRGVGIPSYRQKSEKSRIYFPVICVAVFLSQDFVKVDQ